MNAVMIDDRIKLDDGTILMPVVTGEAYLSKERRARGFSQFATVLIYPNVSPCARLIFSVNNRIMDMVASLESADELLHAMRMITKSQDDLNATVESLLAETFDPIPASHHAMMEISDNNETRRH